MNKAYYAETLAIVPAYCEKENIQQVIAGIKKQGIDNILVVNDCSKDNTKELAEEAGVKVISHSINLGASLTLQTGYKYALAHNFKYIIQLDGDGQHDPKSIPLLLEPLYNNKADLIIGSRFLGVGNYIMPTPRKAGRAVFIFFTKLMSKQSFTDPTSGYKAMKADLCQLFTSAFYPDEYPDADILIMAHRKNFRILEIGVEMHQSNTGKSIHNGFLKPLYYVIRMVLGIVLAAFYPLEKK